MEGQDGKIGERRDPGHGWERRRKRLLRSSLRTQHRQAKEARLSRLSQTHHSVLIAHQRARSIVGLHGHCPCNSMKLALFDGKQSRAGIGWIDEPSERL